MKTKSQPRRSGVGHERKRLGALRDQFQRTTPTLQELLASGDYEGPIAAEDAWPIDQLLSQLKRLRAASGLTQKQLAAKIGMDVTAMSRLESGRQANVTMQTLERVARGLGYALRVQMRPLPSPQAA